MRPDERPRKLTRRSASPSGKVFRMMASVSRAGIGCRRAHHELRHRHYLRPLRAHAGLTYLPYTAKHRNDLRTNGVENEGRARTYDTRLQVIKNVGAPTFSIRHPSIWSAGACSRFYSVNLNSQTGHAAPPPPQNSSVLCRTASALDDPTSERSIGRWGCIRKSGGEPPHSKVSAHHQNTGKTAVFGGFQILLTTAPAGQHYRTRFPAPGPAGAGFAFRSLSATLSASACAWHPIERASPLTDDSAEGHQPDAHHSLRQHCVDPGECAGLRLRAELAGAGRAGLCDGQRHHPFALLAIPGGACRVSVGV